MALEFAHGAIQWNAADAATTTYTVSGLSFQPKALRFYWVGIASATDANSEAVNSRRGVGVAVSTTERRAVGSFSEDTPTTANAGALACDDCIACTTDGASARDGLLDLSSIETDGFILVVDDAAPADITVFWEAWGGSDITVAAVGNFTEAGATGDVDYTVTGFVAAATDQVVMLAGVRSSNVINGAQSSDTCLMVGFASGGASANNIVVCGNSDDGSGSMDTDGYCKTGECLAQIADGGGNPDARAQLTQFGTDNFRLNWLARTAFGRKYIFLAIKGGNWAAGSYTIEGQTASATATVSGLSFTPIGVSLIGRMTAEQSAGTSSAEDRIGLGTGSSTSSRRSMGVLDENGTADAEINTTTQYDQVLSYPSTSGTLQSAYDINAMNSDGFQIIVDTNGGVTSEWQGYLAFGNVAAGTTDEITSASFTLTPASVGSLHHHASQIASASFALTPSAVGSLNHRTSQVASASFVVTPSVVGSLHHHVSQIASASFSLTPSAVDSTYNAGAVTSQVESASFALTPSAVGSLVHRTSQIASASFAITPGAVGSFHDYTSQVVSVAFLMTTSSVGSLVHRTSQVASASFVITTSVIDSTYNASTSFVDAVEVIKYLLANDVALTAVVPTTRIMAGPLPLNTTLPAISIRKVSSVARRTVAMASAQVLKTARIQVTVLAASYSSQKTILKLARAACANMHERLYGLDVDSILPDSVGPDMSDSAASIYMQSRDFMVSYSKAA